jgi:hypothetical protein
VATYRSLPTTMALRPSLKALHIAGNYGAGHTLDIFCTSDSTNPTIIDNRYTLSRSGLCLSVQVNLDLYDTQFLRRNRKTSAKMARVIDSLKDDVFQNQYADCIKVIFRPQVQPWHASSTFTHEAAIAVRTAPTD